MSSACYIYFNTPLDNPLLIPYCEGMDEKTFQRSVSADLNVIVRLQRERERKEVCWICGGTGLTMHNDDHCPYCGGFGMVNHKREPA